MAATKKASSSKIITVEDSSGMVYHLDLNDCYICANAIVNKYNDRHIVVVPVDQLEAVIEAFRS